ncbi:unnamed protein product [Dimorphilus gyrociliatus]|uniref:P/Homo B domain-containing protein n=1 Tax=Dimorphilus gyrociliatus TaxID=2664684 RepID=A0A7I8W5C0_9ANNE|nr:unnamed protein product [Dimorphilus gyrociliatus]
MLNILTFLFFLQISSRVIQGSLGSRKLSDEFEHGLSRKNVRSLSFVVKFKKNSRLDRRTRVNDILRDCDLSEADPIRKDIWILKHKLHHESHKKKFIIDEEQDDERLLASERDYAERVLKIDKSQLNSMASTIVSCLHRNEDLEWFRQEIIRKRTKRQINFQDPKFQEQWHLMNEENRGMDINVTGVWNRNFTGRGVTVAVVDDGLEWRNKDLIDNYNPSSSYDLNSNDNDPTPRLRKSAQSKARSSFNHHGTRCAGEIAAVPNNFCGVGVAFNAKIAGIRLLDGPLTDALEAKAFSFETRQNDIFSCSWGPEDDGATVDGPHKLASLALAEGVLLGRGGRGSIYVVASGNGGFKGDNCNYDGYANSPYTITIGAVTEYGKMPFYAEQCASMLAVTFSSGSMSDRAIVTTDWTLGDANGCTASHTGTSAAAPIAAGIIALILSANPCLSWRDVQYLIVLTAKQVDPENAQYKKNKAGLQHSYKHGFGLLDAWRLVNAARIWQSLPWQAVFVSKEMKVNSRIPGNGKALKLEYHTPPDFDDYLLNVLEYALVSITLTHECRGEVEIILLCPSGTKSVIGARRKLDNSTAGLKDWQFSTVRCWGEPGRGKWTLLVKDHGKIYRKRSRGKLVSWQLKLTGTSLKSSDLKHRQELIKGSYSGIYLNSTFLPPCSPPNSKIINSSTFISKKVLKILLLFGCAALISTIWELLENLCSSDTEIADEEKNLLNTD